MVVQNQLAVSSDETALAHIWDALTTVMDPEIPVLSVVDLGIIVAVEVQEKGKATVTMTPTFSGCPALKLMEKQIRQAVLNIGYADVEVKTTFETTWSTNRISEKGREIIKNFGLAPPKKFEGNSPDLALLTLTECPHCGSKNTTLNNMFGPTLCRSMHYCFDCLEAFEALKPL